MSRWVWLGFVAVLAAACGGRSPAATSGDVQVELSAAPRTIAALRPVTLELRFTDQHGRPLAPQTVEARASMPEMAHGAENVTFKPVGQGRYEAAHTFSMDGQWEIEVQALIEGKQIMTRVSIRVGTE